MRARLKRRLPTFTADQLREKLDYDQRTGEFRWKVATNRVPLGSRAGGVGGNGYWMIGVFASRYYAHHLAWYHVHGEWPTQIDHKDGDPLNNAITNLRTANQHENMANTRVRSDNALGIKGVCRSRRTGSYIVQVVRHGRHHYIGAFKDIDDAQTAYGLASALLFKDFARVG
jgi:hypothetical protein